MGHVDLAFESLSWPVSGLILGMKIDTRIATGRGLYLSDKVKVFEGCEFAIVKKVAARTFTDQLAVHNFPTLRIFLCNLPTVE